jgi:tight adherence protein C
MPVTYILALGAIFISVAVAAATATSYALSLMSPERRRLRETVRQVRAGSTATAGVLPLAAGADGGTWDAVGVLLPKSRKEMERLRTRLQRAGVSTPVGPVVFSALEILLPLTLGPLPLLFLSRPLAWYISLIVALVMFFVPGLWLERRLTARRKQIQNGLPDALDLMVVCIEAGSGLDQAIAKVADEMGLAYPVLSDEFRVLLSEIRAGRPRIDAFKSLAQRTKLDDMRALVATLVQTDKFGTSVGQALRTHADSARTKRRQRAEEAAQKIAVKLVFPLVLCFFPALYVVVLGPAVIQLLRAFAR